MPIGSDLYLDSNPYRTLYQLCGLWQEKQPLSALVLSSINPEYLSYRVLGRINEISH